MSKAQTLLHDDNARRYTDNQERWQEFSAETVKMAITALQKNPRIHFQELYVQLAKRRAQIAVELNHGIEEGENPRTEDYGKFRTMATENAPEYFFKDGEQVWSSQAKAIFEKVELLKSIKDPNVKISKDQNIIRILNPYGEKYKARYSEFEAGCSKFLSQISILDGGERIEVLYSHIKDPVEIAGNWAIMNDHFQDALASKTEEEFVMNTGRLLCFLGKMFPVKLGSAAIGQWIVDALASHKGYSIEFNLEKAGKIGWDFNAMVSPNPEEYAKWFKDSCRITKIEKQPPSTSSIHEATGEVVGKAVGKVGSKEV